MFAPIDEPLGIGLLVATAAVIGALSPQFVQWWLRPLLRIDFREDENNVLLDDDSTWIRVRVWNKGHRRATECQAFITAISELRADNTLQSVAKDAKILQWAGGSQEPRSVPKGVEFYVDLLRVRKDKEGWGIIHDIYPSQRKLQEYSGTYQFDIMISGDNAAPARCKIRVEYKQDWSTLRAWRA